MSNFSYRGTPRRQLSIFKQKHHRQSPSGSSFFFVFALFWVDFGQIFDGTYAHQEHIAVLLLVAAVEMHLLHVARNHPDVVGVDHFQQHKQQIERSSVGQRIPSDISTDCTEIRKKK